MTDTTTPATIEAVQYPERVNVIFTESGLVRLWTTGDVPDSLAGLPVAEYVNAAALAALTAERDELREALAASEAREEKLSDPSIFWDADNGEAGCDDVTVLLDEYDIGEVVEVACAHILPNQWAVGYVTETGGFRSQTFATEAEAVEFAAARAALAGKPPA